MIFLKSTPSLCLSYSIFHGLPHASTSCTANSQAVPSLKTVPTLSKPSASKTPTSSTPSALSPNSISSAPKKSNTVVRACSSYCPMCIWIVRPFWRNWNACSKDIPLSVHCPSLCLWEISPPNHFHLHRLLLAAGPRL